MMPGPSVISLDLVLDWKDLGEFQNFGEIEISWPCCMDMNTVLWNERKNVDSHIMYLHRSAYSQYHVCH